MAFIKLFFVMSPCAIPLSTLLKALNASGGLDDAFDLIRRVANASVVQCFIWNMQSHLLQTAMSGSSSSTLVQHLIHPL